MLRWGQVQGLSGKVVGSVGGGRGAQASHTLERTRRGAGWRMDAWRPSGRPCGFPFALRLEDLGLSLDVLRTSLDAEDAFGAPLAKDPAECKLGFFDPPLGRLTGKALTRRVGALASRPGASFANSYLWQYDRGSAMGPHTDRAPLDITMSIPISLDGADAWPVRVRQPDGAVVEWPSRPGTALVFDGRWRPHWRDAFQGRRAVVLLLHWRAPAVLWRQLVDDHRRRLLCNGASGPRSDWGDLLTASSSALARSVVPQTALSELEVVDLRPRTFAAAEDDGVVLLTPLENELALTFDHGEVAVAPGDGIAFAARDGCRLEWPGGARAGRALVGHGRCPRAAGETLHRGAAA